MMCVVLLAGCTEAPFDGNGNPGDGKTVQTTFTLSPEFVEEITVRSVTGADEKIIKDLWVIQLNEANNAQLKATYMDDLSALTPSSNGDYKIAVPLAREASKVYFVANTHNPSAYTSSTTTATQVEAVAMAVATESDIASANGIPMSGIWSGTPDLTGITERVSLSRAVAKVNFTLSASLPGQERFILKSVTMKQVPKTLHYYRNAASLDTYPYPATPAVMDYQATTYPSIDLRNSPQSAWWYLPENARGTGSATIQTDKAKADKLPTGQAAYCTYIEVTGRYEAVNGTYNTTYQIYLGANNTNDYNLKRNTAYNVATTMRGIDVVDTRINTVEKSIIVGPFGGWDGTQYTKLLEVQSVETANDPQKEWATTAAASTPTNATNIHYGVTNVEALKTLSADLAAYPAAKYCADLGNGWYLPSLNQLMAIWVAYKAIPSEFSFNTLGYWSSSEGGVGSWYLKFDYGYTTSSDKKGVSKVRCVRDITPIISLQPAVVVNGDYVVIDSRNMPVETTTATPKKRSTDGNNTTQGQNTIDNLSSTVNNEKIYHYFAVSKVENSTGSDWAGAYTICKNYNSGDGIDKWRLPTHRELLLIWILRDKLIATGVNSFGTDGHWSATEYSSQNSGYVNFFNGHTGSASPPKTGNLQVRCVRDL